MKDENHLKIINSALFDTLCALRDTLQHPASISRKDTKDDKPGNSEMVRRIRHVIRPMIRASTTTTSTLIPHFATEPLHRTTPIHK